LAALSDVILRFKNAFSFLGSLIQEFTLMTFHVTGIGKASLNILRPNADAILPVGYFSFSKADLRVSLKQNYS